MLISLKRFVPKVVPSLTQTSFPFVVSVATNRNLLLPGTFVGSTVSSISTSFKLVITPVAPSTRKRAFFLPTPSAATYNSTISPTTILLFQLFSRLILVMEGFTGVTPSILLFE